MGSTAHRNTFVRRPCVRRRRPRSIYYLPLLGRTGLINMLCLRGQLTAKMFAPRQSRILRLLSARTTVTVRGTRLCTGLHADRDRVARFLRTIRIKVKILSTANYPCCIGRQKVRLLKGNIRPATSPRGLSRVCRVCLSKAGRVCPARGVPLIQTLDNRHAEVSGVRVRRGNGVVPIRT